MSDNPGLFSPEQSESYDSPSSIESQPILYAENSLSDDALSVCDLAARAELSAASGETKAQERRRRRLALMEEFGGHMADVKQVAQEALKRGMYSPKTRLSDVELSFLRTWKLRSRNYNR